MPCIRADRHRPHFEPIALPVRNIVPVELNGASASSAANSGAVVSTAAGVAKGPVLPKLGCFAADEIVRGVFLGTSNDATYIEEMERRGIRNILNVATECDFSNDVMQAEQRGSMKVKKVHLVDHSDHDIAKSFPECNDFILAALQKGEGVLVHCRMGVSRSASVVIAFLMSFGGIYFPQKLYSSSNKSSNKSGSNNKSEALVTSPELQQPSTAAHRFTPLDDSQSMPAKYSTSTVSPLTSTPRAPAPSDENLKVADRQHTFPMSYSDSFDVVKERRREIAPNLGFCLALREIDVERGILEDLWDFSNSTTA